MSIVENPYKYNGPLDISEDELVVISRKDHLKQVVKSLKKGNYWAILGPRAIGKTTF